MSKKKNMLKKDWYEILNENLKFVNKDFEDLKNKRKQIMNENIKLNKIDLIKSNLDNKYKPKNENKNPSELGLPPPEEKKLILNRLNIRNYKAQNYISGSIESLFLKHILEKIDKINTQREYKIHKKKNNKNIIIQNIDYNNKLNKLTSPNKNKNERINNKEEKRLDLKNNSYLLSKTFNGFIKDSKISQSSNSFFPKIKNKRNSVLNSNKKELMKTLCTEELKTISKGKSLTNNIFKLNREFIKNKNKICGYDDKEEDYIIINNKKIYPINFQKEINQKLLRQKFLNIKKLKDIETNLLNDNKNIFESTKKHLLLKYKEKRRNKNYNFSINNTDNN